MSTIDHYKSRREDMRRALAVANSPEPEDHPDYDEYGAYGPDALSVEVERLFIIVLGTGGPHDEVRIRVNRHDEVTGGTYGYYWNSQEGHGEHELDAEEAQEWADAYGIPDAFAFSLA